MVGMRTLKGLFVRMREGLYLEGSLVRVHELGPPYVEDGVARVEARLEESKIDDMEEEVLLWLVGLRGVWARGRFR
jgi:hypothetical protein